MASSCKCPIDNAGGGVFIAVHNNILATHESKLHSDVEVIWIKIKFVKQKSLYFRGVKRYIGSRIKGLKKGRDQGSQPWDLESQRAGSGSAVFFIE